MTKRTTPATPKKGGRGRPPEEEPKRGRGRPPKDVGDKHVRRALTLTPEASHILDELPDRSRSAWVSDAIVEHARRTS